MDCKRSSLSNLQLQKDGIDYISQMSDDILVVILSLTPFKDAVATSILARRWRYTWQKLRQLNLDGGDLRILKSESEREKFINQVNSVIRSYNKPTLGGFRIRYAFKPNHQHFIYDCIEFAVNKKVEFLELDFMNQFSFLFSRGEGYDVFKSRVVVLPYLKKLILKGVLVREEAFEAFLMNSPLVETISICDSPYLYSVHVNGRQSPNLKHLKIMDNFSVRSVNLSDLNNLVSFTCRNSDRADFCLAHLPNLKEINLQFGRFDIHNVFIQMSSCALSLQSLSITVLQPEPEEEGYSKILDSVPMLPNLKNLKLTIGGGIDDQLVFLASIMNACPNLETFSIMSGWTSPKISMKKARDAANPHKHLKIVEIVDYVGRKRDFELAEYIIRTFVALKKVKITVVRSSPNYQEAFRSSAEGLVKLTEPKGVELIVL
ncbi:F-box protein At4g09920-like isoform X2 [Rutidosis leptorrhynchoides]|uniref:F-box protein At4g09920-like isoform X2 n=1 Tax=Rutidosis leptorrhynchoides TaxID=125765 RepID=UPI003A9A2BC2